MVSPTSAPLVAIFNADPQVIALLSAALGAEGLNTFPGNSLAIQHGEQDLLAYLDQHDPQVVVWDIVPPYAEHWQFLQLVQNLRAMEGRGFVVTAIDKAALAGSAGSAATIHVLGKPYGIHEMVTAVLEQVTLPRLAVAGTPLAFAELVAALERLSQVRAVTPPVPVAADPIAMERSMALSKRVAASRYQGIIEHAFEGIIETTASGTLRTANQAALQLLGYDSAADLFASASLMQRLYLEPGSNDAVDVVWDRDRISGFRFDTSVRHKGGGLVPVRMQVRPHWQEIADGHAGVDVLLVPRPV